MSPSRGALLGGLAALCTAASASAQQGAFLTAGRVTAGSPNEASWRFTVQRDLAGPLGVDVSITELPGGRPKEGELYGAGADLALFSESRSFPTVFVGASAGLGTRAQPRFWSSGSIGLRMPVVLVGALRLSLEGRWRNITVPDRDGLEFGISLGYRNRSKNNLSRPESAGLWAPRATAEVLRAGGIPESKARLLSDVVATALEEMGQPYVWGGTGDGSGGYDCSGLIYYAYARFGVPLPRTAASQAKAGTAIRRDIDALLPGDVLTFVGDRGDAVVHVGLYVGEGRFIHSASNGVRLSRLREDDPDGRWWLRRWSGVRRMVE
ncbi:MAG: C40 family peptidase [Gemmatimonadota bacterium]